MKRFLGGSATAGLLVIAALAGTPAAAQSIDPAKLIKLASSVLKVEVIRTQGGYSLGSGVVVGADRVVTNCHVTRDASEIAVVQGGLRVPVQAQQVDVDHDLCLLHAPGIEGSRAAALTPSAKLRIGQPLIAVGHTAGMLQNSPGEVLALHRLDGARVVQTSSFFSSGASGGGLFDADSKLVGILTFRLRGGMAHYFAMPSEWLERQLRAPHDTEQAVAPRGPTEMAFWERPPEAQPDFLRAAVFENDSNWNALQPLATQWLRRDADDPEPWFLLGLALSHQDQPREAQHALGCALALAPDMKTARAELDSLAARHEASAAAAVSLPCHL